MDSPFNPARPVFDFQLPDAAADVQLEPDVQARIAAFEEELLTFRAAGPMGDAEVVKLRDYFRIEHVYHSAGIEGNRLTLRETEVVLTEGLTINDKPLADQMEVRGLDDALRFLEDLSKTAVPLREIDIREIQRLVVNNRPEAEPGSYRSIGVLITGSEHRPPEPLAVPALVDSLVDWVNRESGLNPLVKSAVAHHFLAAVHPFVDGNGRVARLVLNLIMLRSGYPIVNIKREDRPKYYEALTFADLGLYSLLVELVLERALDVFKEMKRIREETQRAKEWAARWGKKEAAAAQRREEREYKLWLANVETLRLEFKSRCELLNETLESLDLSQKDYPSPEFSKYLQLKTSGRATQNWFFTLRMRDKTQGMQFDFLFRFFRNYTIHNFDESVPIQLNWFVDSSPEPVDNERIRLREIWLSGERQWKVRMAENRQDVTRDVASVGPVIEQFFDDVLKSCFGITPG